MINIQNKRKNLGFRIIRKRAAKKWDTILTPIFSLIFAFFIGVAIFAIAGVSPITTVKVVIFGAFGSLHNLSETIVKMIPLLLTGLSVTLAFKVRFFNIGAEGQLIFGAIVSSGVALFLPNVLPNLPKLIMLITLIITGMLGGALWILIPVLLKTFYRVSEVITTIMLNYVSILFMQYLYDGPWKDPHGWGFPGSARFAEIALMPRFFGTRIHLTILIAIVIAILLFWLFQNTRLGYEISVIGLNERAAQYAGMDNKKKLITVIMLSGAIAGIAGAGEVTGVHYRLFEGLIAGYGFTATSIAWLARLNPLAVIPVSFFMAALSLGGDQLQIQLALPKSAVQIFIGIILLIILAGDLFLRYSIVFTERE